MDGRLRLSITIVIIVALLVGSLSADEKKERKGKKKEKKQKGDKGGGSKEDRAIKQILKNMAKASKPLRLPPPSPNNKNNNNNNNNDDDDQLGSRAVHVSVDFGLSAVTDVNSNGGYVDLEGTLTTVWQDPRLKFDLSKVSKDLRTLRVDPASIWTPDLEVYNAVAPGLQTVTGQPLAVVSHSGDVFLSKQVRLRSSCDIIGQLAVSQIVNCTLKMGSWTYNGFQLHLNMKQANIDILHAFTETGQWTVTAAKAWVDHEFYSCCPEFYPYFRFSYILKKRALPADL